MQPSEKCYGISSAISVMRSVLSGRGCRCCVAMDQLSWQPNAISCSSAINACVKGHEWQAALALVDTRRLAILNPNAINYATAISGCEGMAEWQRVLALLTDMDWLSLKSHSGGVHVVWIIVEGKVTKDQLLHQRGGVAPHAVGPRAFRHSHLVRKE